ncbi:MAG: type II toxin-antitoxin system VapC family toxin [Candidatus Bathyarchaeia archaeon]
MESYGKRPEDLEAFLSSLVAYEGLRIYFLSLADRVVATRHMDRLGLDFDDALTHQAMRRLGVTKVVSYDAHFDKVPIKRVKPSEIAQHALPPDGNV